MFDNLILYYSDRMHSLWYAILNTLNTVVRNVGVILIIYFNNSCFILMCQRFLHLLSETYLVAIYTIILCWSVID